MERLLSAIRNLLLAFGSGGVVAGIFTEQQWATIVSAVIIIGSAIWKEIERHRRKKAESQA